MIKGRGIFPKAHAIGNLLPSRTPGPFSVVSKAILIHVHDAFSAPSRRFSHGPGAVAQLLQRARSVPIDNHVDLVEQLLKHLASLGCFEIKIDRAFPHVSVDLEEWDITEIWTRHLEDLCAVFAQDSGNGGAGNDAAHVEDLDAR